MTKLMKIASIAPVLLFSGCVHLGITSSLTSEFIETVDPETGNIEATVWKTTVRNGLFSKIDKAAMQTLYRTFTDEGKVSQEIIQGSDAVGIDSTGQIEGVKIITEGITKVISPISLLPIP